MTKGGRIMNHRYFYIPLMLLAAASCSNIIEDPAAQDIIEEPAIGQGGFDIIVNARLADESDDAQTKVTISQVDETHYNMNWSATGETATLVESRRTKYGTKSYASNTADLSDDGVMAFSFGPIDSFEDQAAGFGYDIFYPQSAFVSSGVYNVNVVLGLPAAQTPLAASPDPSAALLCGRVGVLDEQPTTPINATFTHLVAYGKMNLKGIPSEETISSIEITSEDNDLAGQLTYFTWDGTVKSYSTTTEHTITLDGSNLTANPAGFDVWFACKPFNLAAGSTLVVNITTSANVYTCALKAKADMAFEKGVVTSFPATPNRCTVTFESNGGTVIAPVVVKKGEKVAEPSEPTKAQEIVQGLYLGELNPDAEIQYTFGGWYTNPECTVAYDFEAPVNASIKLYAKWAGGYAVVPFEGDNKPNVACSYVSGLDLIDATTYTYVMTAGDEYQNTIILDNPNARFILIGKGAERVLSHTWGAALVQAARGTFVISKNITLSLPTTVAYPAVLVQKVSVEAAASCIMKEGAKITGCNSTARASAVYINNGNANFTFEGGEISGNKLTNSTDTFAGTISANWGSFVMTGGTISGNSVSSSVANAAIGGAASIPYRNGSSFRKTGGIIESNTATYTGSGTAFTGQQLILGVNSQANIWGVNDALGVGDNLSAADRESNPLWLVLK